METTPIHNYSGTGWQGEKYKRDISINDIAKHVRHALKDKYPTSKFSITCQKYSGGQSMDIILVESDVQIFATPNEEVAWKNHRNSTMEETLRWWTNAVESGRHQVNEYSIKDDYILTADGKEMMLCAKSLAQSYNFDDSDAQIDYFHTNFYLHLSVGKYGKPFTQK